MFTLWRLCTFLKGRKEVQPAVGPLLFFGKSLLDEAGYLYVNFTD